MTASRLSCFRQAHRSTGLAVFSCWTDSNERFKGLFELHGPVPTRGWLRPDSPENEFLDILSQTLFLHSDAIPAELARTDLESVGPWPVRVRVPLPAPRPAREQWRASSRSRIRGFWSCSVRVKAIGVQERPRPGFVAVCPEARSCSGEADSRGSSQSLTGRQHRLCQVHQDTATTPEDTPGPRQKPFAIC